MYFYDLLFSHLSMDEFNIYCTRQTNLSPLRDSTQKRLFRACSAMAVWRTFSDLPHLSRGEHTSPDGVQ